MIDNIHDLQKTSMVKTNNTCQLTDLPGEIDVDDVAKAFETDAELNHTTQFFLKSRKSRLGFEERAKLLPEVQGLCGKTQLVRTQDFEVNKTEYEKFHKGEVIYVSSPINTRSCIEV